MAGQQLIYETSCGKLTFGSLVKYRQPGGSFIRCQMPPWAVHDRSGIPLTACHRTISDDNFDYTFEAAACENGYKLRLSIRNLQTQAVEVAFIAPVAVADDLGQLVWSDGSRQLAWLQGLGYQSSSPSAPVKVDTKQDRGRFSSQREMCDNYYPDIAPEAGIYILDWQGLLCHHGRALFFSALTSNRAVTQGAVTTHNGVLRSMRLASLFDNIILAPGEELASEWLYLTMTAAPQESMMGATDLWGQEMAARTGGQVMSGWAPQLRYKNRITQQQMEDNLAALRDCRASLPMDYFTIGDGYQAAVGDWLAFSHHYQSVPDLLGKIGQAGFTKSMWLTPFVCQSDSKLMQEHPDWLLKDEAGRPKVAGSNPNWRGRFYALDCTNPQYLAELARWFSTIYSWGVRFFKVGLCYAGALPGRRYDQNKTGLEALRGALAVVRQAIGEAYLDMGSIPFGAGVGIADAMRIGPPVDRFWQSQLQLFSTGSTSFASAANSITATLNRWHLHRRLAHSAPSWAISGTMAGNKLTKAQLRSLYTSIAISGGLVNVSENLQEIKDDLPEFSRLFPLHMYQPQAISLEGAEAPNIFTIRGEDKNLVAFFNWSPEVTTKALSLQAMPETPAGYHLYDPWENTYYGVWAQNELKAYNIPPYGCRVFVATVAKEDPQLIGVFPMIMSHLLPGIATNYQADRQTLEITFKGYAGRTLEAWCAYPDWCLVQHVKVEGGALLESKKRGPIVSYRLQCDADSVVFNIRCLNQ